MAGERLPDGSRVRIQGLKNHPENNGTEGSIVGFLEDIGKYKVQRLNGKTLKVKPENLELIPLPKPKARKAPKEPKHEAAQEPTGGSKPPKEKKRRAAPEPAEAPRKSAERAAPEPAESPRKSEEDDVGERQPKKRKAAPPEAVDAGERKPKKPKAAQPEEELCKGSGASQPSRGSSAVLEHHTPTDAWPRAPSGGARSSSAPAPGSIVGTHREVLISKAMSRVLRHTGVSKGLLMRPDGFCSVAELLSIADFKAIGCTSEELAQVVRCNSKRRFELQEEAGEQFVRALQGHSIKQVDDDALLTRLTEHDPDLPTVCVHGTYRRHVTSIREKGLIAGGGFSGRKHVHFAPREPGSKEVISGMRTNCEVAIYVDLREALRNGVPFYRSGNEVLLSPGLAGTVPARYITLVRDL